MEFVNFSQAKKQTKISYLSKINVSAKLQKNAKNSRQYTAILYLAPAKLSGYNVCRFSTPECRMGCLNTSGRCGMELVVGNNKILNCRINRTKLFKEQPEIFMDWLIAEIKHYQKKAIKDNMGFSVRLNGTSDIDWANVLVNGKNIYQIFPDVNFYEYTKDPNRFTNVYKNYHLTFSYTGRNWKECEKLLNKGYNIAVVFNVKNEKQLPKTFNGYKVINGDNTDYRINDENGVIVGLKFKHIANKDAKKEVIKSCFVVQPNDVRCNNVQSEKLVNKNNVQTNVLKFEYA